MGYRIFAVVLLDIDDTSSGSGSGLSYLSLDNMLIVARICCATSCEK